MNTKNTLRAGLAGLALSALMAATANGQVSDGMAELDILPGWRTDTGAHMAAVRVRLAPGWKTYWRAPGDAGIPPIFDWEGSGNLADVAVHWPVPHVFAQNGLTSVGYKTELILPIELTPADPDEPISLRGRIDLGVCEGICVPLSRDVAAELSEASVAPDTRIVTALDSRPTSAIEAGASPAECTVTPQERGAGLRVVTSMPPAAADEFVVIELPDSAAWISEAEVAREGELLTASVDIVPPRGTEFSLDRDSVRITILAGDGAVELLGCS